MVDLDPRSTAVVLVDLQKGIVGSPLAPRSGSDVVAVSRAVAEPARAAGALIVLVNVAWSADLRDLPPQVVDKPMGLPAGGPPAVFSEFCDQIAELGDLVVTKRQWGAFYGTELDLQLRRRGVDTVVLMGIATNFGVESTARQAWERGYDVVVVEDATTSASAELHAISIDHILPRIARVRASVDVSWTAG